MQLSRHCTLWRMCLFGIMLVFLASIGTHHADAMCLNVAPPDEYEHDKFGTVVEGQSASDNVTCRYRAYISVFDGADDDDGDGEADFLRIPHFVAYEMRRAPWFPNKPPKGPKRPAWMTDKILFKNGIAPHDVSYRYSKAFRSANPNWYDRGHLCMKQHAWRLGKIADKNTHTMFNAVPQRHAFNAGIWLDLEDKTAEWANKFEQIWIIAGPLFDQGPHTPTDFIGEPNRGELTVAVPDRLFKIIVRQDSDGQLDVLAFVYSQHETQTKSYDHSARLTSVDDIEAGTGLDFFTKLLDADEAALEMSAAKALWN